MSDIEIKINKASFEILKNFYNDNNNAFNPPLSMHVNSIEEYAMKLKNNAITFEAWNNNELVGLVAAYLNNYKTKVGFITSVVVSHKYQKQGIAKILMKKAIDFAKEGGFENICLEVRRSNKYAIGLYKNFGFIENLKEFIPMKLNLKTTETTLTKEQ